MTRFFLYALFVVTGAGPLNGAGGPTYATPEARIVIEKMVAAHGGLDRWRAAGAVSFDHVLHIPDGPWMVKHEVVEPVRRRTYQTWPLWGARVAFDGRETWSAGWPPQMMPPNSILYTGFVPVNVVWMTQDDAARLSAPERGAFPGENAGPSYYIITLTFGPETGDVQDYFKLYIHPETYRLRGFETIVTHGGMLDAMGLPPEVKFWGPMYHDFRFFVEADGLIFPAQWVTRMVADGREIGQHLVLHPSLREPFDEGQLKRPPGAVVDRGTKARKAR